MEKNRLEAFSDGVLAIIITIMILELKIPHTADWSVLGELLPQLMGYILSFVYIGIYWGNHHHLLQLAKHVNGAIMWANLHLLFWLSLMPFATGWMGENHFSTNTVVVYAILLDLCGLAFVILQYTITSSHHYDPAYQGAISRLTRKGIFSTLCYTVAIGLAFWHTSVSCALFVVATIIWLVPERSIEKVMNKDEA